MYLIAEKIKFRLFLLAGRVGVFLSINPKASHKTSVYSHQLACAKHRAYRNRQYAEALRTFHAFQG